LEGPSDDPEISARRAADLRGMLSALFASTGTIMLTAGDECGRSQQGNNNAYCQDMPLDWAGRDKALEAYAAGLAADRAARLAAFTSFPDGGEWLSLSGTPMTPAQWQDLATDGFVHHPPEGSERPATCISRHARSVITG
jgi:glycogen operon protein